MMALRPSRTSATSGTRVSSKRRLAPALVTIAPSGLVDLVRNRGGKLAQCRDARNMRELGLCLSQRLLRLRAAHLGGEIGSDAAVAEELSVDVEHGLAAHGDVYRQTVRARPPVPEA